MEFIINNINVSDWVYKMFLEQTRVIQNYDSDLWFIMIWHTCRKKSWKLLILISYAEW